MYFKWTGTIFLLSSYYPGELIFWSGWGIAQCSMDKKSPFRGIKDKDEDKDKDEAADCRRLRQVAAKKKQQLSLLRGMGI